MDKVALGEVLEIAQHSFTHPWSREMFENELFKNPFSEQILARADGKIAGYLFMMTLFDECHIMDFAVHPQFRRKGIGRKIIFYLIEKMRIKDVKKIFLEVRCSNLPALSLYQKAGFVEIAVRKGYYSDPKEDAMILQWKASED
jgi:ribosomal-protein-alanine N-acetyltransferase